jgi:hypothetical protein
MKDLNNMFKQQIKLIKDKVDRNGHAKVNEMFTYETLEAWSNLAYEVVKDSKYKLDKIGNGNEYLIVKNDNYELNKSVIATNEAVQDNFKSQNKISYWNIGLTCISVIFIMTSTIQQCTDRTDKRLELIGTEIAKQDTSLKKLVSSLDTLILSMKKENVLAKDTAK